MPTTKPIVTEPVDGNIFAVMGACSDALKKAGQRDRANEMRSKVMNSGSYDEALTICQEYVDFDL
jgi:hypothetical protein